VWTGPEWHATEGGLFERPSSGSLGGSVMICRSEHLDAPLLATFEMPGIRIISESATLNEMLSSSSVHLHKIGCSGSLARAERLR
jgi:hypothetical protein